MTRRGGRIALPRSAREAVTLLVAAETVLVVLMPASRRTYHAWLNMWWDAIGPDTNISASLTALGGD